MVNNTRELPLNVAIVVPVYKKFKYLDKSELKLIEQIKSVFTNREIFIILPESLEADWKEKSGFKTIIFNDSYFKDKLSYSKLLCRKEFYESFSDFFYIQIIQTDCWVFEDKLDYFSKLGFDYIGAPWMEGGFDGYPKEKLWKTGNGGFSLRKVSSFISTLEKIEYTPKGKMAVFKSKQRSPKGIIKNFGIRNNLKHYIKEAPGEDIFWSVYVPQIFNQSDFKIADPVIASHYAFEVLPRFLFEKVTNGKLPMGCHNWLKNDPDFWKKHIKY
jgi:hypothetical protein